MTREFTIEVLIESLIGPVEPCGSHGEDMKRLENLKQLCEINERITEKLCDVATVEHQDRASMKAMAVFATNHLLEEVDGIGDALGDAEYTKD